MTPVCLHVKRRCSAVTGGELKRALASHFFKVKVKGMKCDVSRYQQTNAADSNASSYLAPRRKTRCRMKDGLGACISSRAGGCFAGAAIAHSPFPRLRFCWWLGGAGVSGLAECGWSGAEQWWLGDQKGGWCPLLQGRIGQPPCRVPPGTNLQGPKPLNRSLGPVEC